MAAEMTSRSNQESRPVPKVSKGKSMRKSKIVSGPRKNTRVVPFSNGGSDENAELDSMIGSVNGGVEECSEEEARLREEKTPTVGADSLSSKMRPSIKIGPPKAGRLQSTRRSTVTDLHRTAIGRLYLGAEHAHHLSEDELSLLSSYESLDYDIVENELFKDDMRGSTSTQRLVDRVWHWLIFGLVGMTTGLIGFGVHALIVKLSELKFFVVEAVIGDGGNYGVGFFVFASFHIVFVSIAAFLVCFVEPAAAGSGIPGLKGYLNGTNVPRLLNFRTLVVKVFGVIFSVASGLTLGMEGPMIHTGAILANIISQLPGLAESLGCKRLMRWRAHRHLRDYVTGGVAAGVSGAFGAPVGGVLFSLEELSSFWSVPLMWRVFFCSMVGTFTLNMCSAVKSGNFDINEPGLITFGQFTESPYRLWEIPLFLLLAVAGGILGGLFCRINVFLCRLRRDYLHKKKQHQFIEAVVVACLTSSAFFALPFVMTSSCKVYDENAVEADGDFIPPTYSKGFGCPAGSYNQMAVLSFTLQERAIEMLFHGRLTFSHTVLAVYFSTYFVLNVITYGISVPIGMFVPSILMGSACGRLFGESLVILYPEYSIDPGTYALMGAASMLGGLGRMTTCLAVILVETTNRIEYVLPIMMTLTMSKWVGDLISNSLAEEHMELKCIPFVENAPPLSLEFVTAGDVMSKRVVTFPMTPTVGEVVDVLTRVKHNGFPVTEVIPGDDENEAGVLRGIILRNQLETLLRHKCFASPGSQGQSKYFGGDMDTADFCTVQKHALELKDFIKQELSAAEKDMVMDLHPFINRCPVAVYTGATLARVYLLYRGMGIRHLPVVDNFNRVVGILTRQDLHNI